MTSRPSAIGSEIPPTSSSPSFAPISGTTRLTSSPAIIARIIHTGRNLSKKDICGRCEAVMQPSLDIDTRRYKTK